MPLLAKHPMNSSISSDSDILVLKEKIRNDGETESNSIKANASKFQLMLMSRHEDVSSNCIKLDENEIKAITSINILGVELDVNLKFSVHI